jgi:pSer/pThr/pTyr-binding forkhead associated (FHA) protein
MGVVKAMEVKLVVVHGKHAGQEIPIPGPKFFIGRAEDCNLRPHSDLVSRHHCVIMVEDGFVAARDFNSKNGTFVNGQKVAGETELKSGDHLKVGQIEFEVQIAATLAGKKAPKVRSVQEAAARTVQSARPQSGEKDLDLGDWFDESTGGALNDTTTILPKSLKELSAGEQKQAAPPPGTAEDKPKTTAEEPDQSASGGDAAKAHKADTASTRDAASKGLKDLLRRF